MNSILYSAIKFITFHQLVWCIWSSNVYSQNLPYASDRILVRPRQEAARALDTHLSELRARLDLQMLQKIPQYDLELWEVPLGRRIGREQIDDVQSFIEYMRRHHPDLYVQPDYEYTINKIPNDPGFEKQWGLQNTGQNGGLLGVDIQAVRAWSLQIDAKDVTIGILDTGIDWTHPDLVNNIWQNLKEDADGDDRVIEFINGKWQLDPGDLDGIDNDNNGYVDDLIGWDFKDGVNDPMDKKGHGTHVAGIIGAEGNNEIGIVGVCWNVQLMPLKFMDSTGTGNTSSAIEALTYALDMGVSISNNSWGGIEFDTLLYETILEAQSRDHLFIAGGGNESVNSDEIPFYPSSFDLNNILSVGAHNNQDRPASFSNFGQHSIDIFAPGDGIYSTWPEGKYTSQSGTSMATPFVTGAAALLKARYANSSYEQLKATILETVSLTPSYSHTCHSQGRLNIQQAIYSDLEEVSKDENWSNFQTKKEVNDLLLIGDDLWIAIYGGGLVKMNTITGEKENFNVGNSGLHTDFLTVLCDDRKGGLWIGGLSSLHHFDGENWAQYPLGLSVVISMALTPDGELIVCERNVFDNPDTDPFVSVLNKFDGYTWFAAAVNPETTTSYQVVERPIAVDHYGQIWNGMVGGLVKIVEDSATLLSDFPFSMNALLIDSLDNLWVGSRQGVLRYNINTQERDSWLPEETIITLKTDRNGNIWAGMENKVGWYNHGNNSWQIIPMPEIGLRDNTVEHIALDNHGEIWVGNEGGLVKYHQNTWELISLTSIGISEEFNYQTSVPDKDGGMWYCTDQGIYHTDGLNWRELPIANCEITLSTVVSMAVIDEQDLWLGTPNGLFHIEENTCTRYDSLEFGLRNNYIGDLLVDKTNRLWVGTQRGITMLNSLGNWVPQTEIQEFFSNTATLAVSEMEMDADGNIWVGMSNEGLLKYDGSEWIAYTRGNSGLPSHNISHLSVAGDFVWLGINRESLARFDKLESWEEFQIQSGISLQKMVADNHNNLWLSSRTFIHVYFSKFDGNNWIQFNSINSGLTLQNPYHTGLDINELNIDAKGRLWIGTSNGLSIFSPELAVQFSTSNPTPCIDEPINFVNETQGMEAFEWWIDGNLVSTNHNFDTIWHQKGEHLIKLLAKDSLFGNLAFLQYINVQEPIEISLGPDTTACADRIYLDIGIPNMTYLWQNPEGDTLGLDQGYIVHESGDYILQATDVCGHLSVDTIAVTLETDSIGSCVWPGDVDNNGWVNMLDFLVLGAENGYQGSVRPDASLDFVSQPSLNWGNSMRHPLAQEADRKHADCDGDGIIDISADGEAIFAHAQGAYPSQLTTASTENRIHLHPRRRSINLGDTIVYDVFMSHARDGHISDAYGLAFTMKHNLLLSQNPFLDYSSSWLGRAGEDLFGGFIKYPHHFDIGLTRSDHRAKTDSGKVAEVRLLILAEDIDTSKNVHEIYFTMNSLNAVLMEPNGTELPVNTLTANALETVTVNIPYLQLDLQVWLQGAYKENNQMMSTALRRQNLLPKEHPYGKIYQPKPDSIPSNVVDWIVVELRYPEDPSKVFAQRAAWLLNDGRIVDPEDGGPVSIVGTTGFYFISIRHRNHLSIMSANTLLLAAGQLTQYDFSHQEHAAFGTNAMIQLSNGKWAMYAGDINQDKQIAYSGYGNDRAKILSRIGVSNPTAIERGYWPEDLNLDALVKYSGSKNDRQLILRNIGIEDLTRKIISHVP